MAEFRDRDDIERWLKTRSREEAIVLAARAALRALPALATALEDRRPHDDLAAALILPVFRATTVPWAMAKYPAQGAILRAASASSDAASSAAFAAFAASAVFATSAAARAARATASDAAFAASDAAFAAACAASDAAVVVSYVSDVASYVPCAQDATILETGVTVKTLADRPLWQADLPEWVSSHWTALKAYLLARGEDWEVWTAWYEARLRGGRLGSQAVEVARVTLPEELWKQGPKAVNAEIRRLIEADRAKRRNKKKAKPPGEDDAAAALRQRPSSHRFEWRGDRIEATPVIEPPFDPVLAEAIAAELRDKAAETLAALVGNHADEVVSRAVARLNDLLGLPVDRIPEGILLMRANTLAAHAAAFAHEAGGRNRTIRALLADLAASVGNLVDCYPGIRRINANRLALDLQTDRAAEVEAELRAIVSLAAASGAVAPSALAALGVGKGAVDDLGATISRPLTLDRKARFIENRGETVSARLLDATNFVSATAQKAGSELAAFGGDSWTQIRKRVPKAVGKGVAKGTQKGLEKAISGALQAAVGVGALALAHGVEPHWGAIAVLAPMLGPHARHLEKIVQRMLKALREDAEDPTEGDEQ